MTARKQIGTFSSDVIQLLNLNISPGTPIYIGESNIEHIKKRHPYEYEKYFCDIEDILKNPDYVGQNPHGLYLFSKVIDRTRSRPKGRVPQTGSVPTITRWM